MIPENKSNVSVKYIGKVQGVGFRYSVCHIASKFEVTGYVKNIKDGNVELVAEGGSDELTTFLNEIESSHLKHYIVDIEKKWGNYSGSFNEFCVAY